MSEVLLSSRLPHRMTTDVSGLELVDFYVRQPTSVFSAQRMVVTEIPNISASWHAPDQIVEILQINSIIYF